MPREICVDWTGAQGSGMTSVFFFGTVSTIADQRTALHAFLTSYKANISNQWGYVIRTTGREMDSSTGTLTGAWVEASAKTGTGGVAGQPIPDASQVLYQWHTNQIISGRFLRGRTFLPGLTATSLTSGNITPGVVTGLTGYGTTLIAAAAQMGVWHRPVNGGGGQWHAATAATVWPELAVLRRRRK